MSPVPDVPVETAHKLLHLAAPLVLPEPWRSTPLSRWSMDADDLILRQLFRQLRPRRHLEFGTWRGEGVIRCVEECDATVWTVNVLEGESRADGTWAYSEKEHAPDETGRGERLKTGKGTWVRTDAYGMIGRKYLEAGWGRRVCQIYADSRKWDTGAYPDGFFDTCFVDGGHLAEIVENDTSIATRLVRRGGLVAWHDFCPVPEVIAQFESVRGPVGFVAEHVSELREAFEPLFWISPSWLLVGVRR